MKRDITIMRRDMRLMGLMRLVSLVGLMSLTGLSAHAQIKIGGNVYGGGNHAEVRGSTKVTVKAGDIGAVVDKDAERPLSDPSGKVFGGARMANVRGSSFVHIDGENATDFILINQVFGGNDIAGQIGTAAAVGEEIPTELTEVQPADGTNEKKNKVDNTFNSYVRISTKATNNHYTEKEILEASTNPDAPAYGKSTSDVKPDPTAKKVYIGQLFGGGNGDFDYEQTAGPGDKVTHSIYNWSDKSHLYPVAQVVTDAGDVGFQLPEIDKTYLEIKGGSIVYGYGGGNNATVKQQNIIHIDNPSAVVNHILVNSTTGEEANDATYAAYETSGTVSGYTDLLSNARFVEMGINTTFSQPSSGAYQIGRFFGGNNKAEMSIRPTWNLLAGKVRNLYSGGNRGAMTSPEGLLLEIKDYSSLIVDNLYGGCRMADVKPTVNGEYMPCKNLPGYSFPDQLSARTLVSGGHVNNVYGGNDVTGTVYGGNAVGIYTTVFGDVYGGGNGAYPYTENQSFKDDQTYGDFYFGDNGSDTEALNAFRPNAEQVSIRLKGTAENKTIIKGSVFVGGNCASLATKMSQPRVELKIGSHVIADKVFLGNNGEKMVDPELLSLYKDNSSISLTDPSVFASYMEGVTMPLEPSIVFDSKANGDPDDYEDYTTMIGSFFGGGNRGSMAVAGKTTLKFDRKVIVFDKIVGGCNDANVAATDGLNAAYEGGLIGAIDERSSYTDDAGKIKDRLEMNFNNVVVKPMRWNDTYKKITSGKLTAGKEYYETDLPNTKFIADGTEEATATNPYYELETIGLKLEWNTAIWSKDEDYFVSTGTACTTAEEALGYKDEDRRLIGGNIYGGCYSSGHVNGNVIININQDVVNRSEVFAEPDPNDEYKIKAGVDRGSGVLLAAQGDDVQATEMSIFGAGYGAETEIWGSTTINHNNGYVFQIFGGGEEGVVGKKTGSEYAYNAAYSTTVNLKGTNAGYSEEESGPSIPEAEYLYGGGCEGIVLGHSRVYLGNGRVYDVFGGASNADIYGGTEVHIGYNGGFPWIRDNVYGGNDFGGTIRSNINNYMVTTREVFENELKRSSTYVKYIQGRVDSIFGGNYGNYDYADRIFKAYTNDDGTPRVGFSFPHLNYNSFIHFVPEDNSNNYVSYIFGGSAGHPGNVQLSNSMQQNTYVLLDDTKTKDINRFANVDVYGGGAFAGVGTSSTTLGAGRTAIDVFAGSFHNIYGGCNQEGLVGYTRVNVPAESTARVNALFGGGKGYDNETVAKDKSLAARFCDHYATCIDYKGKNAIVIDAIYGGNENRRNSNDTYINIEAPVMQGNGYQATIYGAGYGAETVASRTNVFMNNGSNAYKVFGGGRDGNTYNFDSQRMWLQEQFRIAAGNPTANVDTELTAYGELLNSFDQYLATNPIELPSNIGTYPNADGNYDGTYTNDVITGTGHHQTNVHIMNGANVSGYAYGGGFGADAVVAGSTFIELKGGNVEKDIYGGGQGGSVYDEFELKNFVATTNVNIEGGMARNVYGGGYLGDVGKHTGDISSDTGDIPGVANLTIGTLNGTSFYNGVPAIQRNAYGGGEGGSVYGTANLTINNGYIGYRYKNTSTTTTPKYEYVEELDDQTPNAIVLAGNAFGGGYVINSFVDNTDVKMYGGTLRGSLYGGGELGPIGRGTMKSGATGGFENGSAHIYKGGTTKVQLFDGHVKRNVFGGGRGKDSWGGDGTKYMDAALIPSLDLKAKGYVFGKTEVDVYGGEVGTDEGVAQGYGNVFGAGDIGAVYSATGTKKGERYDDGQEGYYYTKTNDGSGTLTEDCKVLVEPWCKANVAVDINSTHYAAGEYVPTSALNYLGNKYTDATTWTALGKTDVNKEGIIIHNAVFAGGNTSPGSTEVFANTPTVFGNATASIHDVYNRDLISIGRGRVGGLYGDGNLTLVDGYRELNITNYGTDYYHITHEISLEEYQALPIREAAYYEIRYKCITSCTDKNGKTYAVNSTITADDMLTVFDGVTVKVEGKDVKMLDDQGKPLDTYWKENGVLSRYAGRPMNTIQRADFCGVFGSRMVMQGAQDRVPEVVDYTNYTINRVREVSLNKKKSVRSSDTDPKDASHGNYFGIHSVVNYLGALTSDVDFHTAVRTTNNDDTDTYGPDYNLAGKVKIETTPAALEYLKQHPIEGVTINDNNTVWPNTLSGLKSLKSVDGVTVTASRLTNQTYYDWKAMHHDERKRNNGSSHNQVALASGVYLELTSEKSSGKGLYEKDWGYITGVVELDLINVQPGTGGGYVYAKNEHGVRSASGNNHTILTALNTGAVTNKIYSYDQTDGTKSAWETSGNFVHSSETIIDDCYNIGDKYLGEGAMPAHYWFIKGAIYVYDQYISAYTGSPNAFSETVSIPLTITSASHGRMTLINVMPNRYAYYADITKTKKLGEGEKIVVRDKEYGLNDAINYWDFCQLPAAEKNMFVEDTYVVITDCTYGDGATPVTYKAGTVLLPSEYESLKASAPTKDFDEDDQVEHLTPYVHHVSRDEDVDFDYVFRPSNNVSHDTGYILTYNVDNPNQWNTWYTPKVGSSLTGKVDSKDIKDKTRTDYEDGPTYTPKTSGIYGQNAYEVGSIISNEDYLIYEGNSTTEYPGIKSHITESNGVQAKFYPAYIVTADVLETTNKSGTPLRLHKGATLAAQDFESSTWSSISSSIDEAYVVTKTVQLSNTDFIYRNSYLTASEIETLKTKYSSHATEIDKAVQKAYYCTEAGKYGGNYYETGKNYRALAAFAAMSESDRQKFTFNYDALDLLIDPDYSRAEGVKYQYDGPIADNNDDGVIDAEDVINKATYSLATPIDYEATYKGSSLEYKKDNGSNATATNGTVLSRTEFESLPNEQYYWAPISVTEAGTYYVVKETIVLGDTPYAAGQVISSDTYDGLSGNVDNTDIYDDGDKAKVDRLTFDNTGTYYYCNKGYTIDTNAYPDDDTNKGAVTDIESNTHTSTVPAGTVINSDNYNKVINKQKNFSFHGLAPTETSTLYVTRNSDIFDLSKEKIITVIYQYDYVESDMSGAHITPVSERHILNIHLNFKSGAPTVEDIHQPDIILPGTALSMTEPYVTPGAYEITGGGWKLFDTENDAERHINGVEYTNSLDPLYLYQNKYYLAYYAKTYLGETYSNHVPVSVANYHDLKKVMDDKAHHYYIDHQEIYNSLNVVPKIYINDYKTDDPATTQNGLDLLKDLYDLSLVTNSSSSTTDGYTVANGKITAATDVANQSLVGHALLNNNNRAERNLEFFLRTDINHTGSWTPIGYDDDDTSATGKCFDGVLHGDGHTISGLDHSLFNYLCGEVYNLGVTGSFTGGGIAEQGNGYVENCWINTTGTPTGSVRAVFGNPTAGSGVKQIVNSYYQTGKGYSTTDTGDHGLARAMNDKEFYNGTVAYNLNNFYLYKRYNDGKGTSAGVKYNYWIPGEENPRTGYYANNVALCSSGYNNLKYVENRFADGDFRYADGTIPETQDERHWVETATTDEDRFSPIWPDDYIFFGQELTYGYAVDAHQNLPAAVARDGGRLSMGDDANRVFRAPAYYRSKTMGVAHFNPYAYLAQKSKDGTKEAYPGMTAIDFAGHNDVYEANGDKKAYELGLNAGKFYAPLLDDDGLLSITNIDETQNLLAYAPAAADNKKTHDVLTSYFEEPVYNDYYTKTTNGHDYRLVSEAPTATVHGHLVQSNLEATTDHLLVDYQDFNAPLAYDFDNSHRMWYQRIPTDDEYVDLTKGWQGISIPFTAELVTTHQKGEITHFYNYSENNKGHEYWLRQLTQGATMEVKSAGHLEANFHYPNAGRTTKDYDNTFLWDYYYKKESQQDRNQDIYQTYYNSGHTYHNYPLLTAATPYILGLPGKTYYEFDLSGQFEALNTFAEIAKLEKQVVSFVSNTSEHIGVSDDETTGTVVTYSSTNYTFKPSYMNEALAAGTNSYALNTTGSSYDKVPATGAATNVGAFRPYFVSTDAPSDSRPVTRSILFANDSELEMPHEASEREDAPGTLNIHSGKHKIIVSSDLRTTVTVNILSANGITMKTFDIEPGQTVETRIINAGAYIVQTSDGRYIKKLAVR